MTSDEEFLSPLADVSGVASLVADATIEVIPLKGAEQKVLQVPRSSTLTITCSPKFGLDRSLEHVEAAIRNGFTVVPHLAARMVADEAELRGFVRRVTALGVDDLYVIAGDAEVDATRGTGVNKSIQTNGSSKCNVNWSHKASSRKLDPRT